MKTAAIVGGGRDQEVPMYVIDYRLRPSSPELTTLLHSTVTGIENERGSGSGSGTENRIAGETGP